MSFGKQFEEDFQKSFKEEHKYRILRLYDTTNGFAGVANPCDFIYFSYPRIGLFELKSTQGNRLPFSNITEKQWNELLNRSKVKGVIGAILIQYRDHREGFLVPLKVLDGIKRLGRKSIHVDEARKYGMPLNLIYARTRCHLDPDEFLKNFVSYEVPMVEE